MCIGVFSLLLLAVLMSSGIGLAAAAGLATFVFGDSLLDPGNNNYISTISRANYIPNGIDFGGPTGRFTNGRTIIDILGEKLSGGFLTPPYMAPDTKWPGILKGVNYASGAAGILNETGRIFGGRINMDAQIDNFANTRHDIISRIGPVKAQHFFNKAMFAVSIGSNDFLDNYLLPLFDEPKPPKVFIASMIQRFKLQLTRLYNLGARKIVVVNVGPIGCIPYQRDVMDSGDECASKSNELAQSFNSKLRILIRQLSRVFKGAHLIHADAYSIVNDIITNYTSYGFENASTACCRLLGSRRVLGSQGGLIPCIPLSTVCQRRNKYVFWDPYHPSDAANVIIAGRLLDGDRKIIRPMNIRHLASI
ncbi:unnamed protein product [Linum trigynum]|uniref:GDSL esterase/lipase n=1 Tax=Linum trigynum TaxID=586398 RepID=A0AAV2GTB3_9ROSI